LDSTADEFDGLPWDAQVNWIYHTIKPTDSE
jgi:hypothetical protein